MALTSLPVLDLSALDQGAAAAEDFRSRLLAATHDVGFFYLTGHGLGEDEVAAAFATAERFFALPLEDKLEVEMANSPHFRGYNRTGGELTQGRVDWREQIDLGAEREAVDDPDAPAYLRLEGPNQWPSGLPELRETFTAWGERCSAIGTRLLREWAVALGSAPDVFDAAFADRPSTLVKLIRYPGRREGDTTAQGVGAHKDPGVLTLLMIEPGKGGLQVEHDGGWIDAPALPGAFVVNIGELLEFATSGYLKATSHRVVSPEPGQVRLSIPFFLNPALDSTMPALTLPPSLAAEAPGVTRDPDNVISPTFGDNLLKARLRAHPDVAARHHPDLVAGSARG
ncbi:2-oxoglutarate and iron-dependent oxygenase domain-containing protein [Nostocoides sp. Soil756]|uniref:isopenicillin N synthase family dioxygenase n=1 Tax=Nostocoides sp. Soil756 TaxID=1736399 RepID=UPI0006F451B8|nr:2-oxoglutarate and iron-dependent oxygenase domain-containing protein [Tetrasphaera sp. Soil756]KRE60804.1 oxidoreductase [Tetrasphaera sp. Soil756]